MSRTILILSAIIALSCSAYAEDEPATGLPDTQRTNDCVLDAPNARIDECRLPQ